MVKAKWAHKVETLKQPSCYLRLRAPYFYPDRIAPNRSVQQAEEARRTYGDTAVGLTHSRGVGGVMPAAFREPGTLEGVSSRTQRDAEALAIH
jgi:hypothetical protein